MNVVTFPELNLKFEVSKIAFNFFGIEIYTYAICIVVGILTALIFCIKSEDNYYVKKDCLLETLLFAIVFGIIGARLYYVIFNFEYYLSDPLKIFNLRDGGLALYGGFIVGILMVFQFCKMYRTHFLDFLDYIIPFVALAQCIGRWGNFFNMEAYGYETTAFFRMRIFSEGNFIEVHPVFLYESAANLIIFTILRFLQSRRRFRGEIFYLYLFLYSAIRTVLEGLRVDSLMLFDIRISQMLSLIIFIYATIVLTIKNFNSLIRLFKTKKQERKNKNVEKSQ